MYTHLQAYCVILVSQCSVPNQGCDYVMWLVSGSGCKREHRSTWRSWKLKQWGCLCINMSQNKWVFVCCEQLIPVLAAMNDTWMTFTRILPLLLKIRKAITFDVFRMNHINDRNVKAEKIATQEAIFTVTLILTNFTCVGQVTASTGWIKLYWALVNLFRSACGFGRNK